MTTTDGFLRNVLILGGGTVVAQAISVLALPILSRLYTAKEFGYFAIFMAVLSVTSVVSSLRYEMSIPMVSESDAPNALALSLFVLIITAAVSLVGVLIFLSIDVGGQQAGICEIICWLPLCILTAGAFQCLSYFLTRKRQFSSISAAKGTQSITQAIVQVILGVSGFSAGGLVIGVLSGQLMGTIYMLVAERVRIATARFSRIVQLAREQRHFPLFTAWASLINVAGVQLPPTLLAAAFSYEIAGAYSFAVRVLGVPSTLVGQAVSQAYFPSVASADTTMQETAELTQRALVVLLSVSFPVFATIMLNGPFIFGLMFGHQWQVAGEYARILAPWLMLSLVASPLSTLALAKGRQRQALLITVYETALRTIALCVGAFVGSAILSVFLFSVSGLVISALYLAWVVHLSGIQWRLLARLVLPFTISASITFLALLLCGLFIGQLATLVLSVPVLAAFGVFYFRRFAVHA